MKTCKTLLVWAWMVYSAVAVGLALAGWEQADFARVVQTWTLRDEVRR